MIHNIYFKGTKSLAMKHQKETRLVSRHIKWLRITSGNQTLQRFMTSSVYMELSLTTSRSPPEHNSKHSYEMDKKQIDFSNFDFASGWQEKETHLLQDLFVQAIPHGLYNTEPPPQFWQQLTARMTKRALTARAYTAKDCWRQYLARIQPLFKISPRPPALCVYRPWSSKETELLRTFIHESLPGGLHKGAERGWHEVKELLVEAALEKWLPFRIYSDEMSASITTSTFGHIFEQ